VTARGDEHRIADIIDAAAKLSERLQIPYETWRDDEDLRLVTERLVEIVGEAAAARPLRPYPDPRQGEPRKDRRPRVTRPGDLGRS
jgi:hypothetical protein